jgi:hypothetical protein
MGLIPAAAAASITGVVGKQLRYSTPSLFRISDMASMVLMSSPSVAGWFADQFHLWGQ